MNARTIPEAWSYTPFAIMDDGGTLCTACVKDESNPVHLDGDADGWRIEGWQLDCDTDGPVWCDHCNKLIVEGVETLTLSDIPESFPVRPTHRRGANIATCGSCGLSWDDSLSTGWTPAPSGRCPFEYFHVHHEH